MKRFVLKAPRSGLHRATLVTHHYNPGTGRTCTVYLGSVDVRCDPALVRQGAAGDAVHIKPGATAQSTPFVLDAETSNEIADWLQTHGIFEKLKREAETAQAQQLAAEQEARQALEDSVREQVEADVRAKLAAEIEQQRMPPVAAAIVAVNAACAALLTEARRLREAGCRLTRVRGQGSGSSGTTELDELQAAANQLRLQAFAEFESACKEAGLMVQRRPRTKRAGIQTSC